MNLYVVIALLCFQTSQSRSIEKDCHGLSCEEYDQTQDKIVQILNLLNPAPAYSSPNYVRETILRLDGTFDGCMRLTNEQADVILDNVKQEKSNNETWKIENFKKFPYRKWDINQIIKYRIDNRFSSTEKGYIRQAVSMWEQNSCLRYQEYPYEQQLREHHILFNLGRGCSSYIGKIADAIPQTINLHSSCMSQYGAVLHEMGHSLGLFHEQGRFDRDEYITINYDNIVPFYVGQFRLESDSVVHGLGYDYNSMMHYSPKDGSSKNGKPTMNSKDYRYQHNMGQMAGFSFLDTKIINLEYCQSVCHTKLSKSCENDGYQDPNNCNQCKCPDGLGGRYCETVAAPVGATCGGTIHIGNQETISIETPGFSSGQKYNNFIECSWLILAPAEHKLKLSFDRNSAFHIYQRGDEVCMHWLEVKANSDMGANGPRFCGGNKPKDFVSTDETMLLVFKSYWEAHEYFRTGFKASVSAVSDSGSNNGNTDQNNGNNNNNNPNCKDKFINCEELTTMCDDYTTIIPNGCKKTCNHC